MDWIREKSLEVIVMMFSVELMAVTAFEDIDYR